MKTEGMILGELVLLLLQRQYDDARRVALDLPVKFINGEPCVISTEIESTEVL